MKDKNKPSIYGVGFIGYGLYRATSEGRATKRYLTWYNMLKRCYSEKYREKYPTYKDCTVCDEWHNFQVFAKWFDIFYINGFHIDKDIRVTGNRIYSPDACMFVSPANNAIECAAKYYTFNNPNGEPIHIYNLSQFCRDNDLCASSMVNLNAGRYSQHRGWTKFDSMVKQLESK